MNATQFIQQHGVDKAREVVEGAPDRATTVKPSLDFKHFMYGICENAAGAYILLSDLKRLVESVDLINCCYKKLIGAKREVELAEEEGAACETGRLKQAIADYESIYGGEHV